MTAELSLSDAYTRGQGLYRTTIAGPGRSLPEAFATFEHSPRVQRVLRHPARDFVSARVLLSPEEGRGYWELTRIRNDLYVILADFSYHNARFELVPGDGLIQFNFKLSGDMTYATSPEEFRFNRPALHLWRQPQGINMREWTAPASHERIVSISIRPEHLADHFLTQGAAVPPRLRDFISQPCDTVAFCEVPLTAQMLDVTDRLINNLYTGTLYATFQEALIYELLCLAVGSFYTQPEQPTEEYTDRELRALSAARALLMKQFAPPPTLQGIARAAGLSVRALTRGFKAVYGETVFDFGFRCRMDHALTLLRDRAWSVDRVSEAVGYSHPTSFATAFHRHFGMQPVAAKRLKTRSRRTPGP